MVSEGHWQLFKALQVAHSAYKRLKGRPTWGVAGNRPEHQAGQGGVWTVWGVENGFASLDLWVFFVNRTMGRM